MFRACLSQQRSIHDLMEIKNVIFDFDGTLADTASLIVTTMQATVDRLNLPPVSAAECRATIGLRLADVPATLYSGKSISGEHFAETYRSLFYELKNGFEERCFPGVHETLSYLFDTGYGIAIASSRSHRSLDEYCRSLSLDNVVGMIVGGDDVISGKPSAEPVFTVTDALGWIPEETLVVGDASVDILMGKAAGATTCGVTYGNGTFRELSEAGADHIIDRIADIIVILHRLSQ